ncbi:hypothetical protein ACFWIW_24555 [Amycolatopsis sp. NPDC058340]|uniref:hypothetical protein n=1 Tax=Amycolatopsis sp. NPDC058340 TaxID=3346453 RepID=UPI00366192D2
MNAALRSSGPQAIGRGGIPLEFPARRGVSVLVGNALTLVLVAGAGAYGFESGDQSVSTAANLGTPRKKKRASESSDDMPDDRRHQTSTEDSSGNEVDERRPLGEPQRQKHDTPLEDEEGRSKPGHPEHLENFRGEAT